MASNRGLSRCIVVFLSGIFIAIAAMHPALLLAEEPAAGAAPAAGAGTVGYVDSAAIKARFGTVTAADMEMLRGKKILFASRSFGLNLFGGLRQLAQEDAKYQFDASYVRYDVFKAGGDLSVIPADAFAEKNIVHFLATYWPHTKRMEEVEQLVRNEPHNFGKVADIVIIFFHTAAPKDFEFYAAKMDAMQRDFPKIKFIYVTAGLMAESQAKLNEQAHAWSELVRARYKGKVPLYDLGKILSDDFRVGRIYCPEYSRDPAGVHPNLPAGQMMMAKGFLLVLKEAFAMQGGAVEGAVGSGGAAAAEVVKLPREHIDYKAVRAILDANGLKEKTVESVSVVENNRITKLYLQEGGIRELPSAIGTLTELRVLHVYGDRSLAHPLLEKISPAIGRCVKLEELLLNSNELTTLPATMASLTNLQKLSLADNNLKDLPPAVQTWAEKYDAEGLKQQK